MTKEQLQACIAESKKRFPDVAKVIMRYSGSGDSGEAYFDGAFNKEGNGINFYDDSAYEELIYDVLATKHCGWEINEGSHGTLVIDMNTGSLTLNHTEYLPSTSQEVVEL